MTAFRKFDPYAALADGPQPDFSGSSNFSRAEVDFSEGHRTGTDPAQGSHGDEFEERAAIVEYGAGVPREWADGAARLFVMPAPPGYPAKRWTDLQNAAGVFLDRFAVQAAALGWSAGDLFGCDPVKPFERTDRAGLLLLLRDNQEIVAITSDAATVRCSEGAILTYRRRPDAHQWRICIWEAG
jgi:hypothetical protein